MHAVVFSELGRLVLGHVLGGGGREKLWGELGSLSHVALYLHLALHESHLGVKLAETDQVEVSISHCEGCISCSGLAFLDVALTILEIDFINNLNLATLGLGDLEGVNSIDLSNQVLSEALSEVSVHHAEDVISFEPISCGLAGTEVLGNNFHHLKVASGECSILFEVSDLLPLGLNVFGSELFQGEEVTSSPLPS